MSPRDTQELVEIVRAALKWRATEIGVPAAYDALTELAERLQAAERHQNVETWRIADERAEHYRSLNAELIAALERIEAAATLSTLYVERDIARAALAKAKGEA